MRWQKKKPDFACIFVGRSQNLFFMDSFYWKRNPEGNYNLTWANAYGSVNGEWDTCQYDKYLIIHKFRKEEGK